MSYTLRTAGDADGLWAAITDAVRRLLDRHPTARDEQAIEGTMTIRATAGVLRAAIAAERTRLLATDPDGMERAARIVDEMASFPETERTPEKIAAQIRFHAREMPAEKLALDRVRRTDEEPR